MKLSARPRLFVLIAWLPVAVGAIFIPQPAGADGSDLALRARAILNRGKVTAFDGNFAAPKIAKELLKRFQAARSSVSSRT